MMFVVLEWRYNLLILVLVDFVVVIVWILFCFEGDVWKGFELDILYYFVVSEDLVC